MKYKVHRIEVDRKNMQEHLESFLGRMEGEVVSIVPSMKTTYNIIGSSARIDYLLIVERRR